MFGLLLISLCTIGCSKSTRRGSFPPTTSPEPAWIQFTSQEGRFRVLMPGEPTSHALNQPTPVGDLQFHMFTYEVSKTKAFIVGYNDYPENQKIRSPEAVLAGVREGNVRGLKGKLLSHKPITINKYPGLEQVIELPHEGAIAIWCNYLVGHRLYQVTAIGPGFRPDTEEVKKFHQSFQLME
jgi:hypothetical protein